MNDIAMFVGAALRHPVPPCNGTGVISTIHVDQYKTKFNDIRIYCTLAHHDLVKESWVALGHAGEPTPDFKQFSLERDAIHYRRCHLTMFSLLNDEDIVAALKAPACYSELLCTSASDLNVVLNHAIQMSTLYPSQMEHYYTRWSVNNPSDLKSLLYRLSGFKEYRK